MRHIGLYRQSDIYVAGLSIVFSLENLKIGFHFLRGFKNIRHDSILIYTLIECHLHFLSHKGNCQILYTFHLLGGLFHEVGAVGSVHLNLKSFAHC